jgi:hypothetical protein
MYHTQQETWKIISWRNKKLYIKKIRKNTSIIKFLTINTNTYPC